MPNPTRDSASRARAGADVAVNLSVLSRPKNDTATTPLALLQPVSDTGLPPWRLARHCAVLIDTLVDLLCTGQPIGITGRKVLADIAERMRQLSEVLR